MQPLVMPLSLCSRWASPFIMQQSVNFANIANFASALFQTCCIALLSVLFECHAHVKALAEMLTQCAHASMRPCTHALMQPRLYPDEDDTGHLDELTGLYGTAVLAVMLPAHQVSGLHLSLEGIHMDMSYSRSRLAFNTSSLTKCRGMH